jgi:hypothetical protein
MPKTSSLVLLDAVLSFIYSSGSSIKRRIDLLAACLGVVEGIMGRDHKDLKPLKDSLNKLIECYEPAVDLDFTGFAFEKASIMNSEIYDLFARMMVLIEDYELLDARIVQEVVAKMWGEKK